MLQAFEAADDLGFGLAFGGSSGEVGDGGLVEAHADDDGAVEGCVGLSVSAAVEAVSVGHAGGCRDRCDTAQPGPGGLGADAVDVVAGDDEHLGGGGGADAKRVDQLRHKPFGELAQ